MNLGHLITLWALTGAIGYLCWHQAGAVMAARTVETLDPWDDVRLVAVQIAGGGLLLGWVIGIPAAIGALISVVA